MLPIAGCGPANKFASFRSGDAPAGEPRALPAFCEQMIAPVKVTPVTPQTDARVAYRRAADERDEANDRLTVGSMCIRDERAEYAGKEPKP